jgi:hypothetical protein
VNITTGSCAQVTACSGALAGTWFYSEACADDPLASVRQYCATMTTVSSTSTLAGRIDFIGSTVVRQVTSGYNSTVNLPTACTVVSGFPVTCPTIQAVLRNGVPTATCATAAGSRTGCDCTVSGASTLNETGTYTSDGGVLTVVTPSTTRTFDTCVTPGAVPSLSVREMTSTLSATERGTTRLIKK